MSKKRKKSRLMRQVAAPHQVSTFVGGNPPGWGMYSGAERSMDRTQIPFFVDETRKEIDQFTRAELQRRVRWLFANMGFVRGLVRNGARLVGYLRPNAGSDDHEWNALVEALFERELGNREVFDRAGKYDFFTAQTMLHRISTRDGDALTVLLGEGDVGYVAFYEAGQIASPESGGNDWIDGVKISRGNRHLAYGLRDESTGGVSVVPAASCVYFGDFDSPSHTRSVSGMAHAVNHSIDITDLYRDLKKAVKTAALSGVVIEQRLPNVPVSQRGIARLDEPTNLSRVSGSGLNTEDVFGGGQIQRLSSGEEIKTLQDSRPHPNVLEFVEDLKRDCCTGYGLQYSVGIEVERMTGPGTRFLMDITSLWRYEQQDRLAHWCSKVYLFWLSRKISRGEIPLPKKGSWMEVSWQGERDLTIDRGREGNLRLKEIAEGAGTVDQYARDFYGVSGRAWLRRIAAEKAYKKELSLEFGLDDSDWSSEPRGAGQPIEEEPVDDPKTEPKKSQKQ